MHMASALISTVVGTTMWGASGATAANSARAMTRVIEPRQIPMMGIMGAFVFTAQMINFTIPGTGSSGHIVGGILLALLLGRYAGFLTIASVIAIQALFFADGGLFALGANVFNMGVIPCFIVYPLLSWMLKGDLASNSWKRRAVIWLSAVVAVQLGAFGVVLETTASGITQLPFSTFVLEMLPIHLAIGVVEGLITLAVVEYVARTEPAMLSAPSTSGAPSATAPRATLAVLGVLAIVTGGLFSWFASAHPDGLEWSITNVTGSTEIAEPATWVHNAAAFIQEKMAFLPDYDFPVANDATSSASEPAWGAPNTGKSISGLIGSMMTLALAMLLGWTFRRRMPATAA
jgi:cobalt/nickel transport system permease protein